MLMDLGPDGFPNPKLNFVGKKKNNFWGSKVTNSSLCFQDQRNRYQSVMEALNMSAAMTAKMTKEFRSPPTDQMALLLR